MKTNYANYIKCTCVNDKKYTYVKQPKGRIIKNPGNFTIANEYSIHCLSCGYKSEIIREYTDIGKHLLLPWYKRIFKFLK